MSQHVPTDLLQAFVDGDVGEQLSIHIAQHIDDCPACATQATGLEPLAAVFAAVEDPVAPPGMTQIVLSQLDRPERAPTLEIAVGASLLACAAILALGIGDPATLAADLNVLAGAVGVLGRSLQASLGSFQLALTLCTIFSGLGAAPTLYVATSPAKAPARRLP